MWIVPSCVYWSSFAFLGYTYVGYPLGIHLLSRVRERPVRRAPIEPSLTVVLACHNEEAHIERKLENLLALDYPKEKLQVIVVSDGSTDRTEEIVARFSGRAVELLSLPHGGKAAALNAGLERAHGELVVFADVRQRVSEDALRLAASFFADPRVGGVVGELVLEAKQGPGVYWAYEKVIRVAEGKVDSVVGGSGCFTAIRRHLFRRLPEDALLDDVFIPMQIVLQGYRVLYRPEIKVYDREASVSGEFARKARTLAGNFQILAQVPELLDPRKNRLLLEYLSHKVFRLAAPFALCALFSSNVVLVASGAPGWPFYVLTLAGQLAVYGLALRGALAGGEDAGRLARVCHTFVTLNVAAVEGLRRYLKGDLGWSTVRHAERTEA
jgi:cellulose synthase/poly-beta-1,6-N-acetylglucosamine synthase-like glycosyltransferase